MSLVDEGEVEPGAGSIAAKAAVLNHEAESKTDLVIPRQSDSRQQASSKAGAVQACSSLVPVSRTAAIRSKSGNDLATNNAKKKHLEPLKR